MSHDEHHHHSHGHPHPQQPDHAEPAGYHELLGVALNELLQEKGVYTGADLRAKMESIDNAEEECRGAKVVARAWVDEGFRRALLDDACAAVKSLGFEAGPAELTALENTETVHNVVVCTLCSCYPRLLLGRPPRWYKSREYRSRIVREPRAVLREFGTELPEHVEVRVHDSTAELRYIVLPRRPEGSEGLSEEELARRVTRDSMIGVTA